MRRCRSVTVGALMILFVACASPPTPGVREAAPAPTSGPRFSAGGPDAADYGAANGFPIGDRSTFWEIPYVVGVQSHFDQVFEGRQVRRAASPSRLGRATAEPPLRYEVDGQSLTLDDYFARNPVTGLLIAQGDTILVERYQYARNDRHRLTSWSMAKSVTAMLVGIAIAEGRIRSVDDLAETYVPPLGGTEYGRTPIRHLLQMSSGVRFVEKDYVETDDAFQLARDTFVQLGPGGAEAARKYNERAAPSGTRFAYASAETQVLGLVLAGATGRPVAEYLQQKIWQPIGAEADASWIVDRAGQESTYCCLNAVLRDYARLALLLAHDGSWRGRQVIPAAWIKDATSLHPDAGHLRPKVASPFWGYGYQTWIFPTEPRRFALLGVRGQAIFVDPQSQLVMVNTAVRKRPAFDPGFRETAALWRATLTALGK